MLCLFITTSKEYKNKTIPCNYIGRMSVMKNIIVDIIIISTIWGLLNNCTCKYFFGLGMSIYILTPFNISNADYL